MAKFWQLLFLVDSKGDPECREWISRGSPVDAKHFKRNVLVEMAKDWTAYSVTSAKNLRIEIAAKEGCVLNYEFFTENKSIRFGFCFVDSSGGENWIRAKRKVDCEMRLEQSSVRIDQTGNYFLVFENKSRFGDPCRLRVNFELLTSE